MSSNEENKLKIHTVIGGFRFPMNIDREDEEIYRNAEIVYKLSTTHCPLFRFSLKFTIFVPKFNNNQWFNYFLYLFW